MAADATFSVRIDNETKDKLAELVEQSGLTAKDFLNRLVTTYETSRVRESMT